MLFVAEKDIKPTTLLLHDNEFHKLLKIYVKKWNINGMELFYLFISLIKQKYLWQNGHQDKRSCYPAV